jgi:hypothetical protein
MSAGTTLAAAGPQKFVRYRNLRGKSVSAARGLHPDLFDSNGDDFHDFLSAAALCHRRAKGVTAVDHTANVIAPRRVPLPPVPAFPLSRKDEVTRAAAPFDEQKLSARAEIVHQRVANKLGIQQNSTISVGSDLDKREARLVRQEAERRRRKEDEAARWADEVARLEAETDRILAEQKKRDIARLQAQLAQKHIHLSPQPKPRSLVLEKFAFFTRSRRSNTSHATSMSPLSSTAASIVGDYSRATSLEPSPPPKNFIERGGKGLVPQTDAPASASNSRDRVSGPRISSLRL